MKKIVLLLALAMLCSASIFAAKKKVAFVYQTGYNSTAANRAAWGWPNGYDPTLDPIHTALAAVYDVTDFTYAQTVIPDTTTLMTYDLVVMSEAMSGGQALSNNMVRLVGRVPLLNMKAFTYTSGRWSWAAPANPATKTTAVLVNTAFKTHPIFKDVAISNDTVNIFSGATIPVAQVTNFLQGFGTPLAGSKIEIDNIIATLPNTTSNAIHEIKGLEKKYMLIPISSDLLQRVSANGVKLVMNACNYLMGATGGFDPSADFKIAYVYDSTYAGYCGIANDPIFNNTVIAEKNSTAINIAGFTTASTDTLAALEKFDLVVISEAMGSGHAFAKMMLGLVNRVPVLNFKSFLYKNTVWNWGAGANPTAPATVGGIDKIRIDTASIAHELFTDVEIIDTTITMFRNSAGIMKNLMQGYTATVNGFIAADKVFATVKGTSATYNSIHEHGISNKYLLIPVSSDAMFVSDAINLSDAAMQMINNAVYYLIKTKSTVLPAQKPTFSLIYKDAVTKVVIKTVTPEGKIYYTTNGTLPTTTSSLYADTLSITANCTVKALTAKQGYNNSVVDSIVVVVKTMAATPSIAIAAVTEGKSITISGAEGASIYYTLTGSTPAVATATLYTGPIVVKRPCVVKAIATMTDKLNSDIAVQSVVIDGYITREKQLVWANFNTQPSTWSWANTDTTTISSGDVIAKYAYTPPTELDPNLQPTLKTVNFNNGFMVGSLGQRINLQLTAVATTGSYSPLTDGDAGASDRAISFLTTNAATDPTTAYMKTTTTYAGPFDIVVWFTGARGNNALTEKLQVAVSPTDDSNSTWTVLDTLTSISDRYIRKRIAYYDATTPVFIRFKSASEINTNSNMMIFDVKLLGEGPAVAIKNISNASKTVVSKRIYTVSGIEVSRPVVGLNIVRSIYSDGSVKVEKIMLKDQYAY